MGEKISIGDYGVMSFFIEVKNPYAKKDKLAEPILVFGHYGRFEVTDVDRKMIEVRDHDGEPIIFPRANLRYFEPKEKPAAMLRDEKQLQTTML